MRFLCRRDIVTPIVFSISSCLMIALTPTTTYAADGGGSVGTTPIVFSNVDNKCINVKTQQLDFWITSMKIIKESDWLTDTNGVGAKADVVLFSNEKGTVKFPMAKSIDTRSLDGKIVRADLVFSILPQYQFDSSLKISRLDIPLILVRSKGDSDMAKYAKAMIAFTKAASSLVPTNPYNRGAELAAEIGDSFFSALGGATSGDQYDPTFQLSFTLGKTDSGCTPNDLHDNTQARISDLSQPSNYFSSVQDVIKTNEINKYCFYKVGSEEDPDIGYITKPSGRHCSKTVPDDYQILNNPQVIYTAWAVSISEVKAITEATNTQQVFNLGSGIRTPTLFRAAQICQASHLTFDKCFKPAVASYLKTSSELKRNATQ